MKKALSILAIFGFVALGTVNLVAQDTTAATEQMAADSSAADSAHPRYPVGATHTTTGDQGGQQFLTGSGRNNDRYSSPFSTLLGRAVLISLTLLVPSLHRRLRRVHGAAPGPNCAIAT